MARLPYAALMAFLLLLARPAWAGPEPGAPAPVPAKDGPAAAPESGSAPLEPLPPVPPPVQMVRTLQLMQDQIGLGSMEAYAAQRGLLTVLDGRYTELAPDTWKDEGNIRAAITFVLSGGKPQLLRHILEFGTDIVPASRRPLIQGALAYVEGREEEARRDLMSIDVVPLPTGFGAQIALAQSALAVRTDPRKSMELLDWVRLVAPGTLLEEGALRREVFVASELGDAPKFERLVARYLREFRNSVYAGNFRQRLASALTRIDFGKDPERFRRVEAMLEDFGVDVQKDLYLLMARAAVDQGRIKSAVMTARRALELSRNDPAGIARANLYLAAASVVEVGALERSVRTLKAIDRTVLPGSDATLLDSALALAQQIGLSPGKSAAAEEPKVAAAEAGQPPQASEQLPAVLKAQEALSRVDKLIGN